MKSKKKLNSVYEVDASCVRGNAKEVVFPKSVEDVKKAVKKYNQIVMRGGGSGLAGGCVPLNGQDVVLDLSKLTKIENFDEDKKTIEVEAGVILDDLNSYLEQEKIEFPVNPSSHGIATTGGLIACNAVGSRAVKYGDTKKWIKWIDIVNCNGNLERKGITEISDYSGMEGTTGVIVKACLKLCNKKIRTANILDFDNLDELKKIVKTLKKESDVSMIEFFGRQIAEMLDLENKYYLLVEYESDKGAMEGDEYGRFLKLRDSVYPMLAKRGFFRIEDPKVIVDKVDELINFLESKDIPVFGHLGVGILHPCFSEEQVEKKYIKEMMKIVKRIGGQITGEHGVGILKKEFVDPNDKKILVNIKKRCDPKNKFNAGKII